MGIETALGAMGMSGATASAVATSIYTAAATAAISAATAPKQGGGQPQVAPLTSTDKPPSVQAEKQVDRAQMLDQNLLAASAAGAMSGNAGTWLTGSGGARGGLNLGTSTLLGQ